MKPASTPQWWLQVSGLSSRFLGDPPERSDHQRRCERLKVAKKTNTTLLLLFIYRFFANNICNDGLPLWVSDPLQRIRGRIKRS